MVILICPKDHLVQIYQIPKVNSLNPQSQTFTQILVFSPIPYTHWFSLTPSHFSLTTLQNIIIEHQITHWQWEKKIMGIKEHSTSQSTSSNSIPNEYQQQSIIHFNSQDNRTILITINKLEISTIIIKIRTWDQRRRIEKGAELSSKTLSGILPNLLGNWNGERDNFSTTPECEPLKCIPVIENWEENRGFERKEGNWFV